MITYKPLWKTLIDKDKKKMDLVLSGVINRETLAKMGKDRYTSLRTIDAICQYLHVGVEDVVEVLPNILGNDATEEMRNNTEMADKNCDAIHERQNED